MSSSPNRGGVGGNQRYHKGLSCPICGGSEDDDRGSGKRCFGYIGGDGIYAHCSREEKAGGLPQHPNSQTFAHRLKGACKCGVEHGPAEPVISKQKSKPKGPVDREYDYLDEARTLLFQVVRYKSKDFVQRRPNGKGGWQWNLADTRRVLYRLPELVAADPTMPVFIVEGEKDVDNLRTVGLVATCNPMGTAGGWRSEYNTFLEGRSVNIIADNDDGGRDHAKKVARSLSGVAREVKSLDLVEACRHLGLGELPEKGDASDFLKMGGDAEGLKRAFEATDPLPRLKIADGGIESAPPGGDDTQTGDGPPDSISPNEGGDDPHRLARIYLNTLKTPEGPTLLYWREEWHRWDGTHYRICPDKEVRGELTSSVKAEFDRLNIQDLKMCNQDKTPPVVKPVTTRKVSDVLQALTGEAMIRVVDCPEQPAWLIDDPPFPADEVLPTRNALVHLKGLAEGFDASRCMVAPTPSFFGAYALEFDYKPDAARPDHWLKFLSEIWPEDSESIETLQEWFGYNITADTSHQKMLMMIGPKRSGRGTIARTMQGLIGDENVVTPTMTGFSTHFGASCLIGKPCTIFTDARISGRSDVSLGVERLLSITGEDPQTIPRKNLPDWKGRLRTKFTLISNELPRLTDASGALSSRMIVLRFTETFLGREDKDLEQKLRRELPGILTWAIGGWRRLRDRGRFFQPQSAMDMVEQMENLSSPVGQFIKDTCDVGPAREIPTKDLYEAWKRWCDENGKDHPGDGPNFGKNLTAACHSVRTSEKTTRNGIKVGRLYLGIDLNEEAKACRRAAEVEQARHY